jgi:hypothetical protein
MKHKYETFEKFKEFQIEVENQLDRKIKQLRSDRGGEYLSFEFEAHLRACGIVPQRTPTGTPQHDGERCNRTLLDSVRSIMSLSDLSISFWGYVLETVAFILNRVSSKSVETTPYELWHGKKPKLPFLRVWGCEAYVKKLQPEKLESKAEKCIFVGYPRETLGYTFYHPAEGKTFVAKTGAFLKKEFLMRGVSGRKIELDKIDDPSLEVPSSAMEVVPDVPSIKEEVGAPNTNQGVIVEQIERRSARVRKTPQWFGNPVLLIMLTDLDEPATYKEAMEGHESEKWLKAMKSEIRSMYDNQVWTLVDIPNDRKAIENKLIFKKKTDADGNVTVYKAQLVAKGFRQIQGVDYDETFSPVAMLKSIRILLAIAAYFDYEIWQMDFKTAFLNGNIEEELYMVQPEGFFDTKDANKVCKLQRSIYGLKEASRSWNIHFDEVIKCFGFVQNTEESCIYKKMSGSSVSFPVLYLDDILLIGNDVKMLNSVKEYLNNNFSMKDMGEATYILGIKIYRDKSRRLLALSQSTYLDKVLKRFKMKNSKKGDLLGVKGTSLSVTQSPATEKEKSVMSSIPYASAIGSIMYDMLSTRPDVALALSLTSRYQSNPGMSHWTVIKNILKFLRRTKDMVLVYGGGNVELDVKSYVSTNYKADSNDEKSQTGYVFLVNGGAVIWRSCKRTLKAKSKMESEYIATADVANEAVWI